MLMMKLIICTKSHAVPHTTAVQKSAISTKRIENRMAFMGLLFSCLYQRLGYVAKKFQILLLFIITQLVRCKRWP